MRVITGTCRGRKLLTPEGYSTRPTTEKVKEAIFSAIHFDIEGTHVLDLFAGTGQMGIEALSRGADKCVFIENDRKAADLVRSNVVNCKLSDKSLVSNMDAYMFLAHASEKFDIVFLDPPYNSGMIMKAEEDLKRVIKDSSIIVCETARNEELPEVFAGLPLSSDKIYSDVHVRIYRRKEEIIY